MRKSYIADTCLLFLLFFLTSGMLLTGSAHAEYEPAGHRWTIGYENGVTLRRFLGDHWEVYLGGGPDDYRSDGNDIYYRFTGDETPELYSFSEETNKTESGFIHLGVGRQLLREDRFWLTAIADFSYRWENFQTSSKRQYQGSDNLRLYERVGHNMTNTFSLGIRPAYDITSRVVLTAEFGFYFRTTTQTTDYLDGDFDGSEWDFESRRSSSNSDSAGKYGIYKIYTLGMMFRF